MPGFTIVIPAWNEEAGIGDISKRVIEVIPAIKDAVPECDEVEFIVVDDGSRDRTAHIVRSIEAAGDNMLDKVLIAIVFPPDDVVRKSGCTDDVHVPIAVYVGRMHRACAIEIASNGVLGERDGTFSLHGRRTIGVSD